MQIIGVMASRQRRYALTQTYTSSTTYTVPTGVGQIAVFCVGRGGSGTSGVAGQFPPFGGPGGAGGGGGGAGAIWNIDVTPGDTWTVTIGSSAAITNGTITLTANGGSGQSGGTVTSAGTANFVSAAGETGSPGGSGRNTYGAGNFGFNGILGSILAHSSWSDIGLPNGLYRSGAGGSGGGGGSVNNWSSTSHLGGAGGNPADPIIRDGGNGGYAIASGNTSPGLAGQAGSGPDGGGGGGGGGVAAIALTNNPSDWRATTNGGAGGAAGTASVYIYER